jgi:SAM-dependent methyltransferase
MYAPEIKRHYQDESVASRYDAERFDSVIGRAFDAIEKRAVRKVVDLVRNEISNPRVLDVPCGTGRITEVLLEQGLEVVGGDISLQMLEVAGAKLSRFGDRVELRRLDLDRLQLSDGSFELVTCIRLLHHLQTEERAPILRELARVSNCFVLVNVSYSSSYYRLRRRLKRVLGLGHSRASSTAAEIEREASAAGLVLVRRAFIAPLGSEDLLLLFRKAAPSGT